MPVLGIRRRREEPALDRVAPLRHSSDPVRTMYAKMVEQQRIAGLEAGADWLDARRGLEDRWCLHGMGINTSALRQFCAVRM